MTSKRERNGPERGIKWNNHVDRMRVMMLVHIYKMNDSRKNDQSDDYPNKDEHRAGNPPHSKHERQ